ncbi:MAG: response regulator transcription factor [Candidatus Gastranaerophilales bacterium]|nr:response regulator transcription factor [Candidatus Gastranaerophilales bacterium]
MIKVLLIEDHQMVRMGLELVLEKANDIELVDEADNGVDGVKSAFKNTPDVILMDIGLPQMDGIEATRKIKESHLDSKILIFTSRDSEEDVFKALEAGADGYIMKGANQEMIIQAIKAVNEGAAWLDPAIARLVLSNVQKQEQFDLQNQISQNNKLTNIGENSSKTNAFGLTERELEVLALIVDGLNNLEIAKKLFITRSTAKAHVHSILQKLYVKDRTKAAVCAMKEGLV